VRSFCFFVNRGHLQVLQVRWLKVLCPESIAWFKRPEKSEFELKKYIFERMKMFRKYQLAIWLSIQNFCSHFTKVTRKCKCFGRILEPWICRSACGENQVWQTQYDRIQAIDFYM
jgi:hypothetical protein